MKFGRNSSTEKSVLFYLKKIYTTFSYVAVAVTSALTVYSFLVNIGKEDEVRSFINSLPVWGTILILPFLGIYLYGVVPAPLQPSTTYSVS
jgi:hypothetical protein